MKNIEILTCVTKYLSCLVSVLWMMAKAPSCLVNVVESLSNEPRQTVVEGLLKEGSLDSLLEMRMVMLQACQQHDNFPKGELYRRRRPKGGSAFTSLEHRLANDIFELNGFLDTGIVSSEIRAMFKLDGGIQVEASKMDGHGF